MQIRVIYRHAVFKLHEGVVLAIAFAFFVFSTIVYPTLVNFIITCLILIALVTWASENVKESR